MACCLWKIHTFLFHSRPTSLHCAHNGQNGIAMREQTTIGAAKMALFLQLASAVLFIRPYFLVRENKPRCATVPTQVGEWRLQHEQRTLPSIAAQLQWFKMIKRRVKHVNWAPIFNASGGEHTVDNNSFRCASVVITLTGGSENTISNSEVTSPPPLKFLRLHSFIPLKLEQPNQTKE